MEGYDVECRMADNLLAHLRIMLCAQTSFIAPGKIQRPKEIFTEMEEEQVLHKCVQDFE